MSFWSPSILLFRVLSTVSILLCNCTFTAFCSSIKLPTTLLKFRMACFTVVVMAEKLKHNMEGQEVQEVHTVEVLASKRYSGDFSN